MQPFCLFTVETLQAKCESNAIKLEKNGGRRENEPKLENFAKFSLVDKETCALDLKPCKQSVKTDG